MTKDIFDISRFEFQETQEQIDARDERRKAYYARLIDTVEFIEALKWCDLNSANQWIDSHKERLTDAYALSEIIGMAMAYGVSDYQEELHDARHEKNRKKNEAALKRWKELKAEGYSKNNAAQVIANEIDGNYSTIRRALQGKK